MSHLTRCLCGLSLVALLVVPPAAAQTGGDDSLEKLLEKLEEQSAPPPRPDQPEPKPALAGEDKGLDSLLEKLGETTDRPETTRDPQMPQQGEVQTGPQPDEKRESMLDEGEKSLDEHLEELLGRKKKEDGGSQDQPSGPLAEAIEKMTRVRERLAEQDTGKETRQGQGEIIQELDEILKQLRQAGGQGKGAPQQRTQQVQQAGNKGNQPGNQPGDQPGGDGKGVGSQVPDQPSNVSDLLAGQKDTWGDLPPSLRQEMENVFREEMLPAKRELIIRYYSAIARMGRQGQGSQP